MTFWLAFAVVATLAARWAWRRAGRKNALKREKRAFRGRLVGLNLL